MAEPSQVNGSDPKLRFPNWVGVVCADLPAQRRFYREVLGFREIESSDGWIQFDMGHGKTFELIAQSNDPEYDAPRYQVGFTVDDIVAARAALLSRGVAAVSEIRSGSDGKSRWAYFRDGEGNVFEISEGA
jgi:catechol 2,3-dioxygenase-like lactoylglutathione lyase family enzyme